MPKGWFGRGYGAFGWGRGFGNPYPFCRWFPWLPRWWRAYPPYDSVAWSTPYIGYWRGLYAWLYGYSPCMPYY